MYYFFFNDTATTEIYTLSLHDALPICHRHLPSVRDETGPGGRVPALRRRPPGCLGRADRTGRRDACRSEEHTSELQSRQYLVCRLLLEKKKNLALNIPYLVTFHSTIYS